MLSAGDLFYFIAPFLLLAIVVLKNKIQRPGVKFKFWRRQNITVSVQMRGRSHFVYHLFKGTIARDFCYKLRLWGCRLGPTDVTHPLLTSVHCPFNLLRSFNMTSIEVKLIISSSQTRRYLRMRVRISMHACRNNL